MGSSGAGSPGSLLMGFAGGRAVRHKNTRDLQTLETDECRLDCLVEWGVRLPSDYSGKAAVIHAQRNTPQVTHFEHLPERRDERRAQEHQPPWEGRYPRLAARLPSDDSPDGLRHLRSILVPMTLHMKGRETLEGRAPPEQFDNRPRNIRKVRPLMSHTAGAGVADRSDTLAGLDQALREPVVARGRPKEVSGTDDEYTAAVAAVRLQSTFHLHPDSTLSGLGILWCCFRNEPECIRSVVVESARKYDCCPLLARRGDGIVEHRQHQLRPAAVSGRIDRVDDHRAALSGRHDLLPFERIPAQPGNAVFMLNGFFSITLQGTYIPAG